MSLETIVAEIDSEITRLQQAKALLTAGQTPKRGLGRPRLDSAAKSGPSKPKRRTLSAAARGRIAAAQKARWAKVKTGKGNVIAAKPKASK